MLKHISSQGHFETKFNELEEDLIAANVFQQLAPQHPELRLVLAPRHPQRAGELVGQSSWQFENNRISS